MDLNSGYTFDEFGNMIPQSGLAALNLMPKFGMSADPNALPPGLQAPLGGTTPLPMSVPNDPGLAPIPEPLPAGASAADKAKALAKAAGNMTPEQAKALGALTGGDPHRAPPGAPAAAIPRGTAGNMQMLTMGTPRAHQTLSQLIYGR